MYKISVIAPVVLTSFLAGAPRAQAQEPVKPTAPLVSDARLTVEQKVDRYLASLPDPFNGTILLPIGDKILLNRGYGLAKRSHDMPNMADTKYELASVSKDFTIVLILKLVEMGLLDLQATIEQYLSSYLKDKASKITIHHLIAVAFLDGCGRLDSSSKVALQWSAYKWRLDAESPDSV